MIVFCDCHIFSFCFFSAKWLVSLKPSNWCCPVMKLAALHVANYRTVWNCWSRGWNILLSVSCVGQGSKPGWDNPCNVKTGIFSNIRNTGKLTFSVTEDIIWLCLQAEWDCRWWVTWVSFVSLITSVKSWNKQIQNILIIWSDIS